MQIKHYVAVMLIFFTAGLWAQNSAAAAAAAAERAFDAMDAVSPSADKTRTNKAATVLPAEQSGKTQAEPEEEIKTAALVLDDDAPELDIEALLRKRITLVVQQQLGVPYRAAGINSEGFDCSGLIYFVYREAAGMELSRSTVGLWKSGKAVASADIKPGDVLIFTTVREGASHAGIVIENGDQGIIFIHAASQGSKRGVIVSNLGERYYRMRFMGARSYF
ncbi:MAG: C40 family peptidase [Treponema sp.]|jgi:cell wall-associated NlpC family hydrolase|nr:C40 family peptidase [Treponema sp.]